MGANKLPLDVVVKKPSDVNVKTEYVSGQVIVTVTKKKGKK